MNNSKIIKVETCVSCLGRWVYGVEVTRIMKIEYYDYGTLEDMLTAQKEFLNEMMEGLKE